MNTGARPYPSEREVPPVYWRAELMPLLLPVRVVRRGEKFYFPSRTHRGMWPVIGLRGGGLQNVTQATQATTYITLNDVDGNPFLEDYPLGLLPINPLAPIPGLPSNTMRFGRMDVCWELSWYTMAAQVTGVGGQDDAFWVCYGNPDKYAR